MARVACAFACPLSYAAPHNGHLVIPGPRCLVILAHETWGYTLSGLLRRLPLCGPRKHRAHQKVVLFDGSLATPELGIC